MSNAKRSKRIQLQALLLGISILGLTSIGWADEKSGVVRTFAFATDPETAVSFLSQNSQMVVAARPVQQNHLTFAPDAGESEESELLDGTTWVFQDAIHVFKGGQAPEGVFLWLIDEETPEPPPTGAVTMTGEGSIHIASEDTFRIALCGTNCGFGNNTSYYVLPYGSGDVFVVVTAEFNR
jgi:hypothetical protein